MNGRVLCDGRAIEGSTEVDVEKITAGRINVDDDLFHQGMLDSVASERSVKRMGGVRVAVIGVDYASKSLARARSQDCGFEAVCCHNSKVVVEVQIDPSADNNQFEPSKKWTFGPLFTGGVGDVLDVGTLETDLCDSSCL